MHKWLKVSFSPPEDDINLLYHHPRGKNCTRAYIYMYGGDIYLPKILGATFSGEYNIIYIRL